MLVTTRMAFAALLIGSTFAMTSIAAHAASPGCPSAAQKTEGEIGAGNNSPATGVQKTEGEIGAGNTQQASARKTEGEIGAGNNSPASGVQKTEGEIGAKQMAGAQPCK